MSRAFFVETKMFNVRIKDAIHLHQDKERIADDGCLSVSLIQIDQKKRTLMMKLKCSSLQFLIL